MIWRLSSHGHKLTQTVLPIFWRGIVVSRARQVVIGPEAYIPSRWSSQKTILLNHPNVSLGTSNHPSPKDIFSPVYKVNFPPVSSIPMYILQVPSVWVFWTRKKTGNLPSPSNKWSLVISTSFSFTFLMSAASSRNSGSLRQPKP